MHNPKLYIEADEVAERLLVKLIEAHTAGAINSAQLAEKRTFKSILAAINEADRRVCTDLHIERFVVVYIPPSSDNILFYNNDAYTKNQIQAIKALDLSKPEFGFFTNKDDYLNIQEVNDRYVYIHSTYPTGNEQTDVRLRKVDADEFFGGDDRYDYSDYSSPYRTNYSRNDIEKKCTFIFEENRLIIGQKYTDEKFARFKARIIPGILSVRNIADSKVEACDYNSSYKVVAPHYAFEYLKYEALLSLLPMTPSAFRNEVKAERERQEVHTHKMSPDDSTVTVTKFSF